jgi:nucleoside-diphosphate-sugar epimerase
MTNASMSPLAPPRVLVAGGGGFVGSALVRILAERGHSVVVLDNFFSGVRANVEGLGPRVRVVEGDALDEEGLRRLFAAERPEQVYNLVGDTFVPSAYLHPRRFFRTNVEACLELLMAAAEFGVRRMLYVSSTEVYGRAAVQPIDEEARLHPVSTYAVSKLAADQLCATFHREHGVPVVVARIFNAYGPRETQPYVVPEIVRQLFRGPVVRLGDATTRRDLTYVDDTARGLLALMASDLPDGEAFHVGSGRAHEIAEVARTCGRLLGYDDVRIEEDPRRLRRCEVEEFRCDAGRLVAATGWRPEVALEDGLRRTLAWYEAHGRSWSWEAWCPDGVTIDPRQSRRGRETPARAASG